MGGKEEISVDVRIISSCNVEPSEAIEKGQLSHDLFYRLAVIYIYIPPLRERLDDIDILVRDFIAKYNDQMGKNVKNVSDEVLEIFYLYNWPGNEGS